MGILNFPVWVITYIVTNPIVALFIAGVMYIAYRRARDDMPTEVERKQSQRRSLALMAAVLEEEE